MSESGEPPTAPEPGSGSSLVSARSVGEVIRTVADQARALIQLDVSGYAVEDGIYILITDYGPVDTQLVSRALSTADAVVDDDVVVVPVLADGEPVAALSAVSRLLGKYTQPCLEFLADAAAASISSLMARAQLERSGVLPERGAGLTPVLGAATPFRALFDCAHMYLMVMDSEGRLVYMNPYSAAFTGMVPDEHLGELVWELPLNTRLDPIAEHFSLHRDELHDGAPSSGEIGIRDADGRSRLLRFQLSPIRDSEQNLQYVLASAIDITDQQEAEASLQRTNEALEHARSEAEKSAHARTEFLTSMSHEIRTPLNAIIGTTTLLLDDGDTSLTNEHAEILRSSAEHLLSVINDILDMSKLDTEKVDIDDDRFEVEALVESSLDLVIGSAAGKGLEMTSIVEPGCPDYLLGDAPRVRQVLVNLLSNAVKYTHEGIVELICRGHYTGPERVELVFEIRDTGPGIASEEIETLFDPFVQAGERRTAPEGTGLGLSISERLVRRMGGTITVHSTVGVGTTFTVSIPFDVDTSTHATEPTSEPTDLGGLKVLIVDDHDINRRVLELETTRWGMVPTLCASPIDALALVDGGRRFDVALLDLNMPEMNGDELADTLRQRSDFPRVLLSSTPPAGRTATLFAAHIHKPIKRHQLAHAIEQALGHTTAGARPADVGFRADRPIRLLVAEDNAVNRKVIRALLNRLGHTPGLVADGLAVLKEMENTAYDVVLLDLRMPGVDGFAAAEQIIERYGDDRPRLVALTASATEEDRQRCLAIGMDDFVTKPVTLDGLSRVLADAEAARGSRR